jgi:hypothetical protein
MVDGLLEVVQEPVLLVGQEALAVLALVAKMAALAGLQRQILVVIAAQAVALREDQMEPVL